jgi:D-alanine-D-alanine ligase-like ATP-grasp enzyme
MNYSKVRPVVLLNGSSLNKGVIDKLQNYNTPVIVVDRKKNPSVIGDRHIRTDVIDFRNIIRKLNKFKVVRIKGCYTSSDIAVTSCNSINKYYDLGYTLERHIQNAISKAEMCTIWKTEGLLNRKSIVFSDLDLKIVKSYFKNKVIIKPDVSSSSRGITIIDDTENVDILQSAFEKAKRESKNDTVIIEEFVDGQEYTVEMLVDKNGSVSVYGISKKTHSTNAFKNRIATKLLYNPAEVSNVLYERISNYSRACFEALKIRNSFGHFEVIHRDNDTFSPIELGARSSGFIASHLIDYASGRNYLSDYFDILHGKEIVPRNYRTQMSSMYYFYDIPPAHEILHKANIMEFLPNTIFSSYNDRTFIEKGRNFKALNCDNERVGYEVLFGPSNILTLEVVNEAETRFLSKLLK